jgi:uncharacterized lipoprotein YehR (DUF1307 family)
MKKITFILSALIIISLSSCTQNEVAKRYGGTATIKLPRGQKLVNATWKDKSIWYLTRNMKEGEKAEQYYFQEESNLGIVQGTVIFKEE